MSAEPGESNILHFETGKPKAALKNGDGDGTSESMEAKVAKLEAYMERAFAEMAELKVEQRASNAKLDSVIEKLGGVSEKLATLPTKSDLNGYVLVGIGLALAVIAIVVGGIVGGLDWLKG